MSDIEHLPWCAHVQNMARPRSQRLIGPKCECAGFYKSLDDWEKYLDSNEGKEAIDKVIKDLQQDDE